MEHRAVPHRNFLLLQGPPGPFFWQLAQRLNQLGFGVFRINLNGGDRHDWPGEATDYRGTRRNWTLFIDRFLSEHAITDLILFGDCRPLHMAAHRMAQLRCIEVHVFEEGYIRPDWLTLEQSGVNGYSSLPPDPRWFEQEAQSLPPIPERPSITSSGRRRAKDAFHYYSRVVLAGPLYPFYRSHRKGSLIVEGLGWLCKFAGEPLAKARVRKVLQEIGNKPYFLFPLQLSNDFQIREHSPFSSMAEAVNYVLYSFARRAPAEAILIIKEHPLDASFRNWHYYLRLAARRHGLESRIIHLAGGDLHQLVKDAKGMVTVNSTSATLALTFGVPVIALGKAIYDMPNLSYQGRLDDFWVRPQAPNPETFEAFRRVLHARCLVYGGLASESATRTAVKSSVERLISKTNQRQLALKRLSR
jgi:capsular polysaccharide export protein